MRSLYRTRTTETRSAELWAVLQSGRCNMIMEADKAIKACGVSSREYRDIILSYSTYKRYIEAEYGTVDSFMRRYKKK